MSFTPTTPIAPFWGWTEFTPALPEFYWDVYSAEERIKKMCLELHKLCDYANMLGENINMDHALIDELQKEFTNFINGAYDDYYKQVIYAWIQANMGDLIRAAIKMVFFGLTDDGYFCAYIPDSWSDITFDTGMVYGNFDYGRLLLRFNVDGASGVIDNTGRYDEYSLQSILGRLQALENYTVLAPDVVQDVEDLKYTLYTPLPEGE